MHSDKSFDIMAKLYEQKIFLNSGKIQKGKVHHAVGDLVLLLSFTSDMKVQTSICFPEHLIFCVPLARPCSLA